MPVVPVGGSRSVATATGETPYPAARRDASPHHMADPVVVATVDDLQRAVEAVKRTVRKAKREIIEDAHPAGASPRASAATRVGADDAGRPAVLREGAPEELAVYGYYVPRDVRGQLQPLGGLRPKCSSNQQPAAQRPVMRASRP